MMPAMLSRAGYVSHHIGKWHQGLYKREYTPLARGFNSSYGFLGAGRGR